MTAIIRAIVFSIVIIASFLIIGGLPLREVSAKNENNKKG